MLRRAALAGIAFVLAAVLATDAASATTTVTQAPFGAVEIVTPKSEASAFVILMPDPDDTTWSSQDVAHVLADRGAAVAVIDAAAMRSILDTSDDRRQCIDLFGGIEELARVAERQIGMQSWQQPVLFGIGQSGAVAYLGLAQSPSNTLAGAVSFGFSPSLASKQPFCDVTPTPGSKPGTFTYGPTQLPGRWIIVKDNSNDADLQPFLNANPGSKVEAGSWRDKTSRETAINAVFDVAAVATAALSDLPLVELPAKQSKDLVIFFSGDGGWRDIDKQIGDTLSKDGVAVIGVDALRYFWSRKDPATIAADIERIIRHYSGAWGAKTVALAGYSFGAGVIPLAWPKLDPATQKEIKLIAMLGPEPVAREQMSMAGWLGLSSSADIPLGPYMAQLPKDRVMCVYSVEEQKDGSTGCTLPELDGAMGVARTGGHHFGGAYREIARTILDRLKKASLTP
jgi:type IV secretory pathway VirJ component